MTTRQSMRVNMALLNKDLMKADDMEIKKRSCWVRSGN